MAGPFLFIFTGTGGSGRKTIAHRIGEELGLHSVRSVTTRPPRAPQRGHSDSDYMFTTSEIFDEMIRNGAFAESVVIWKERYGIRRTDLETPLSQGRHAYAIVNPEGADALKKLYGATAIRLFLYTDKQTVRERLESRGLPVGVIDRYLDAYTEEVVYRKQCEHVIENKELLLTLARIREAIQEHL